MKEKLVGKLLPEKKFPERKASRKNSWNYFLESSSDLILFLDTLKVFTRLSSLIRDETWREYPNKKQMSQDL